MLRFTFKRVRQCTLLLSLSFCILLLQQSCKKGDTGPAGTANVIYSPWFTPSSYTKDTIFGNYGFSYNKATTDITQQVIDTGTVIVFGKLDGYNPAIWPTNQIAQLPISIAYLSGVTSNVDIWSALLTAGNLKIRLVSSTNQYGSISNAHQFRYIIIPGGNRTVTASAELGSGTMGSVTPLQDASAREVAQHYSQMSYEQVCHQLNIAE
jgi:hypothetical protein